MEIKRALLIKTTKQISAEHDDVTTSQVRIDEHDIKHLADSECLYWICLDPEYHKKCPRKEKIECGEEEGDRLGRIGEGTSTERVSQSKCSQEWPPDAYLLEHGGSEGTTHIFYSRIL